MSPSKSNNFALQLVWYQIEQHILRWDAYFLCFTKITLFCPTPLYLYDQISDTNLTVANRTLCRLRESRGEFKLSFPVTRFGDLFSIICCDDCQCHFPWTIVFLSYRNKAERYPRFISLELEEEFRNKRRRIDENCFWSSYFDNQITFESNLLQLNTLLMDGENIFIFQCNIHSSRHLTCFSWQIYFNTIDSIEPSHNLHIAEMWMNYAQVSLLEISIFLSIITVSFTKLSFTLSTTADRRTPCASCIYPQQMGP